MWYYIFRACFDLSPFDGRLVDSKSGVQPRNTKIHGNGHGLQCKKAFLLHFPSKSTFGLLFFWKVKWQRKRRCSIVIFLCCTKKFAALSSPSKCLSYYPTVFEYNPKNIINNHNICQSIRILKE